MSFHGRRVSIAMACSSSRNPMGSAAGLRLVPDGQALPREGLREGLGDPREQVGLLGLVEREVGQDAALPRMFWMSCSV